MPEESAYGYETPYLRQLAGREFQILVLDCLSWLQWVTLGPKGAALNASRQFKKSVWKNIRNKNFPIFEKLLRRKEAGKRPEGADPKEYDEWLFKYLNEDWNEVFNSIGENGTVMGYLSGYLSGSLKLPESRVSQMSIADYDIALKHRLGHGLDDFAKLQTAVGNDRLSTERLYAQAYAKREGAKWIAVYDNKGERTGRAYETISKLFREQVSQAIEQGETLEQLRSRMAYPDLLELLEAGDITEDQYLEWSEAHLNRDFRRFALTEAAYAWHNGKLSEMADRQKETGQAQYLEFVTGGGGGVL